MVLQNLLNHNTNKTFFVNHRIHRAQDMGLMNIWLRNTLNRMRSTRYKNGFKRWTSNPLDTVHRHMADSKYYIRKLNISNMLSVFSVWLLGVLLGSFAFIVELVIDLVQEVTTVHMI